MNFLRDNFELIFSFVLCFLVVSCHEVSFVQSDVFNLFSDGYVDRFGYKNDKKSMIGRFKKLLLNICHLPMADQKNIIDEHFVMWKGDVDQIDDITIVGFTV